MAFCAHCIEEGLPLSPIYMPHTGIRVMVCAPCRKRLWVDLAADDTGAERDINDGVGEGSRHNTAKSTTREKGGNPMWKERYGRVRNPDQRMAEMVRRKILLKGGV